MNNLRLLMIVLAASLLGTVLPAEPAAASEARWLTFRETRARQAARKEELRRQREGTRPSNYMPPYPAATRHPLLDHQGYYPKYYYGFHSRYLLQMGYPPGDIGLRGQAW